MSTGVTTMYHTSKCRTTYQHGIVPAKYQYCVGAQVLHTDLSVNISPIHDMAFDR